MSTRLRPIYLLIYPNPLFAAHWAFFVPAIPDKNPTSTSLFSPNIGTIIQVLGDPSTGFIHNITRNHDLSTSTPLPTKLLLGRTAFENMVDGTGEEIGEEFVDNEPRDALERCALGVSAPGKSLRSVAESEGGDLTSASAPRRVRIENCQTWVRQVVEALIEEGILGVGARDVVGDAPVH